MVSSVFKRAFRAFGFQYSLCRVVLMVSMAQPPNLSPKYLSVLALSSRFDGRLTSQAVKHSAILSVLALSSRFDGLIVSCAVFSEITTFSTRSVESF